MYENLANVLTRQELSCVIHQIGNQVTSHTFASMKQDYQCLEKHESIPVEKRILGRYDKNIVTIAVKFILGSSNTQVLSWGERKLVVGSKVIKLLKVTRKRISQ